MAALKQQLSEMIKAKNEKIAKDIKVEGFQNHLFHNSDLTHSLPFGIHDPLFKYSFLQQEDSDDEDVKRDQQANRAVAYQRRLKNLKNHIRLNHNDNQTPRLLPEAARRRV